MSFAPDSSVVERVEPSPNFDERTGLARPDMIVLHYTGMQFAHEAVHRLCDPKARVSSHYVVMDNGSILQLVPEVKRAWHAGISSWCGDTDINSRSIGIEICNPGHDFGYPDFPARQIAAVITLCRSILTRNIIRPENIVAHSDVAPARKNDPGEKFPWKRLSQSNIGLWVEPAALTEGPVLQLKDTGDKVTDLQKALTDYGYPVNVNGTYDKETHEAVTAFQRHFRPAKIDGVTDSSTRETLRRLLVAKELGGLQKSPVVSAKRPAAQPPKDAKTDAKTDAKPKAEDESATS
jgi:N-acetylmuramoyl-L-alanine amidase